MDEVGRSPAEQSQGHAAVRDAILDSLTEGVFTVDPEWRITTFNKAAEAITGVPRNEALGQHCWEVFRASICEQGCALRQSLSEDAPAPRRSAFIIRHDGRQIPIDISAAPLRDTAGEVIGGVETFRSLAQVEALRRELSQRYTFADIVSKSATMQRIFEILPRVALAEATVLIEGESGTGKELVARALHGLSSRKDGPWVAVNCGALPDNLLESELFGHVAGAFTDARRSRPGRFSAADGGTLFLDEIGDISPALQVRLLRVLQERSFEPLGSSEPVQVDVRVVAATNRDLAAAVKDGSFREDLYYRINVVGLRLPPLRERPEDIPLLVEHFVEHFNGLQGRTIRGLAPEALARLMRHRFPGNVRELKNIVERAFVLCLGDLIRSEPLPPRLEVQPPGRVAATPAAGAPARSLAEAEAAVLLEALARNGNRRAATARELGMHPTTLWRKLKRLGIELP